MQIMFTCLVPLWSVGGRQCFPKLGLTPLEKKKKLQKNSRLHQAFWAAQSAAESDKQWAYVQAFAVADFKPVCWGKIGLVFITPSFIVHIVFVNPTNYISPPVVVTSFAR